MLSPANTGSGLSVLVSARSAEVLTAVLTGATVAGPFAARVAGTGSVVGNGNALAGVAVTGIAVDPANANRVFLTTVPGRSGVSGSFVGPAPLPTTGLYFTDTALGATPVFSLVNAVPSAGGTTRGRHVVFEPGSSNNLLVAADVDNHIQPSATVRSELASNGK